MKKLRAVWHSLWLDVDRRVRLGRLLGLTFITAGVVLIGLGWNGAASRNFIPSQFPYLISGGVMGLGLILIGGILLALATIRAERQVMTQQFEQLTRLLGRNLSRLQFSGNGAGELSSNGQVVAAATVYHRTECRVLEGKQGLMTVSVEQARAEGLTPCRVCNPPEPAEREAESAQT